MTSQTRLSASSGSSLARVGSQEQPLYWTDDLPVCHLSGVGFSTNQFYREDGFRREEHEFEDRSFHFKVEDNTFLYGVFDGHTGSKVSQFAAQRMPAELLLGQLTGKLEDDDIRDVLHQAFVSVEKGYYDSIDDLLAERANLLLHVPEGISSYDAFRQYPQVFKRLEAVETDIAGGTTAVVALIFNEKLYVANVGCSRALLCTTSPTDNVLRVAQLTLDHDLDNQMELERLMNLGLDVEKVQQTGKLGNHTFTRTIGDYMVKSSYKDIEILSTAKSEPVIAEPELHGGIALYENSSFLILMTDGLYKSLEDATGTEHVNAEIAGMVAKEFQEQSTLHGVAQAVVDKIVRIHHDTYMTCTEINKKQLLQVRDDITLLIRNFNYPLPNAIGSPSPGGKGYTPTSLFYPPPQAPLSVHIPGPGSTTMPANRPFFLMNSNTNTSNSQNTLSAQQQTGFISTNSTNDSTQSGEEEESEESVRPFSRSLRSIKSLDIGEDGRVSSYIDFAEYYQKIAELTESQAEAFNAEIEPKPAYETIHEEKVLVLASDEANANTKGSESDDV